MEQDIKYLATLTHHAMAWGNSIGKDVTDYLKSDEERITARDLIDYLMIDEGRFTEDDNNLLSIIKEDIKRAESNSKFFLCIILRNDYGDLRIIPENARQTFQKGGRFLVESALPESALVAPLFERYNQNGVDYYGLNLIVVNHEM